MSATPLSGTIQYDSYDRKLKAARIDQSPGMRAEEVGMEDGEAEEINATFGFFDPTPADAMGIAAYVPQYLNCNRNELAVLVANQGRVGTTIKNSAEDAELGQSLFGFVSVLNLAFYQGHPCIHNLLEWMMSLNNSDLCELLSAQLPTVGLMLNERAYGVPPELSPHICRSIHKEMLWATEDLETEELKAAFRLTHLILVKKGVKGEDGIEFPLVEDEMFFNNAALRVEFATDGEEGDLADLEYHRFIIVLTMDGFMAVREQLNAMFGVDEAQYADE
jgi:hypothetical protein